MKLGDVVVVVGKMDERINKAPQGLIVGTFIGQVDPNNNKIQVLISDGTIFTGNAYDIIPYEGQE